MPRQRYRQDPLPIGPDAPPVELFGPEQPNPPGLQVVEQGQLGVVPLRPLSTQSRQERKATTVNGEPELSHAARLGQRPSRCDTISTQDDLPGPKDIGPYVNFVNQTENGFCRNTA